MLGTQKEGLWFAKLFSVWRFRRLHRQAPSGMRFKELVNVVPLEGEASG